MTPAARTRRRAWLPSWATGYVGLLAILGLIAVLVVIGVLDERRWAPFVDPRVWPLALQALGATLLMASVSMVASLIISLPLALGRLYLPNPIRYAVVAWIEAVRATPVLALVLFIVLFMPRTGIRIDPLWAATVAFTIYTSAVLAEVVRAGIVSIPRGEVEAARSLGLTAPQTLRHVVLPQALSRMIPAIVSQLITLTKDTSLASIAAVPEFVSYGRAFFNFYGNPAETYFVMACVFFVICYTLSQVSRRLEIRDPRAIGARDAA